jgi:hypothetical protein
MYLWEIGNGILAYYRGGSAPPVACPGFPGGLHWRWGQPWGQRWGLGEANESLELVSLVELGLGAVTR